MSAVEIAVDGRVEVSAAIIGRSAGGIITATSAAGQSDTTDPELGDNDDLFVSTDDKWLLALGEHSHSLLSWTPETGIRHLGQLSRLDLSGYDPGGLYRIAFFAIDSTHCLAETEVGFCLVHQHHGLLWEKFHGDLTCRVTSVSDGLVHTQAEYGEDTYLLADGSHTG